MGVFARWVVGFRVYARGVFAFWCLRFLVLALWWGGGTVWSRRPFAPLACLLACSRSGVGLLACAMLPWVRGNGNGAGQRLSRPIQRGAAPVALRAREGLGRSHGVLTRAHTGREGRWERGGEPRGADRDWPGWGHGWRVGW